MEKLTKFLHRKLNHIKHNIADDDYRYKLQLELVSAILCVVALGMCILNIVTGKTLLIIATGSFYAICVVVFLLTYYGHTTVSKYIFGFGIILLFTYFLIFGGTEGFSPMWILMLPACSFIVLGSRTGALISLTMLVICTVLLWSPLSDVALLYDYTESFKMRFPLVYIAFLVVGILFEYIRFLTNKNLVEANKKIAMLAETDTLTGLKNRMAFNNKIADIANSEPETTYACLMFDVDFFKPYNDTYGHLTGDEALKKVAQLFLTNQTTAQCVYRWGGEEIAAIFKCDSEEQAVEIAQGILDSLANAKIPHTKSPYNRLTASVGISLGKVSDIKAGETLIARADSALYSAKTSGRNRVEVSGK